MSAWRSWLRSPWPEPAAAEDVEGTKLFDLKGSKIGEIDHWMVDKISGRVTYAVMSFGGFFGLVS